ncbi:MAG: HlyC/CorC family transporter [Chloroflexi bacterium]|nr:HlyC/CorC family transporter [Chloroflexota bacterium]
MDSDSLFELGVVLLCLALAAFASMADTALRSINRAKIQRLIEEGVPKAEAIRNFLERPNLLVVTILVVNTFALVVASSFATLFVLRNLPFQYGPLLGAFVTYFAVLFFSQMIPRLFAAHKPEQAAMWVAQPLEIVAILLSPFTRLLTAILRALERLLGAKHKPAGPLMTEEELRILAGVDEEDSNILEEDERDMIQGIFELEETTAREIMVPRIDVRALEADKTVSDAIDLIVEFGFSRIPVYTDSIDNILGILYAKDLFKHLKEGNLSISVRDLVRPAYFIPESKKIDELLHELQQKKVHIAIVVDEYGGTAGLVTIEDLLEEIVGEIQDEYDREEAKIVELGDGQAIFDATVTIGDVNDTLGLKLEAEEVDTIGGLIYTQLGKMPSVGDEVRIDGVSITVLSTDGRRIRKVKVSSHAAQDEIES